MNFRTIQKSRIQILNDAHAVKGKYVLYWMQQSQRADYNHALEYAIQQANRLGQGVIVAFGLMDDYPEANLRHYTFMLEGLHETRTSLATRGIKMIVRYGSPPEVALQVARHASVIVCDRGYLKHQRKWRRKVAQKAACLLTQVESDVVVPIDVVSDKAEYAARTIRPKIKKHLDEFSQDLPALTPHRDSLDLDLGSLDLGDIHEVLKPMNIDRSVTPATHLTRGGTSQAKKIFDEFIQNRLVRYAVNRSQPQTDDTSHMSAYLHFGQISPLYLALSVKKFLSTMADDVESFTEELIVRRELAINFVYFNPDYHVFKGLPNWAQTTLLEHKPDKREHLYSRRQLENAQTHDVYWNAAMNEMKTTGYLHSHMRMYWGKKILEWSRTPEYAFKTALWLNNKYLLDGRDPNSYAGIAWIFGNHDRAWKERPVFGKIRYMNAAGLERKCDIGGYVDKVENLMQKGRKPL
jgi:deoxyribodipyrimidine photo-lyase